MKMQTITVGKMKVKIPAYYEKADNLPGDPEGSVPFITQTENAACLLLLQQVGMSNSLPKEKEALKGWMQDPYDPFYKKGILMNLSEQEIYDKKFPEFPLSMCREFVNALISGNSVESAE